MAGIIYALEDKDVVVGDHDADTVCNICLYQVKPTQFATRVLHPNGHIFHYQCLLSIRSGPGNANIRDKCPGPGCNESIPTYQPATEPRPPPRAFYERNMPTNFPTLGLYNQPAGIIAPRGRGGRRGNPVRMAAPVAPLLAAPVPVPAAPVPVPIPVARGVRRQRGRVVRRRVQVHAPAVAHHQPHNPPPAVVHHQPHNPPPHPCQVCQLPAQPQQQYCQVVQHPPMDFQAQHYQPHPNNCNGFGMQGFPQRGPAPKNYIMIQDATFF